MIGLAFDLGHAYVNKSQLQNIADASALAGASALNGTSDGIDEAETRATDYGASVYLTNKTEFNSQNVAIPASAVTYSTRYNAGRGLTRTAAQSTAATFVLFVSLYQPSRQASFSPRSSRAFRMR